MDARLAHAARQRLDVFTRGEALLCGMSDADLARAVRRKELRRLRHGAYTATPVGDARTEHLRRCWATVLFGEPPMALAGPSAATAYGMAMVDQPVEVHLAAAHARKSRGIRVVRRLLPTEEVREVDGLPVTTPARCVVDAASVLSFPHAVVVADSALAKTLVTRDELAACLDGSARRAAYRVVGFADGRSESVGESLARVALHAIGFPPDDLQVWLHGASGTSYRVDFFWAGRALVGEFDGRVKYEDPEALWAEKRREDDLRAAGLHVVRFSWADVHDLDRLHASMARAFSLAA